jgi:hypothetical protein
VLSVVIHQPRVSNNCGWSFRLMESAPAAAAGWTALQKGAAAAAGARLLLEQTWVQI